MQEPFFGFGGFNQGGFGGGQTRVLRRVIVRNDSPTQLSTLDPFLTSRFHSMLPTMEPSMIRITNRRFYNDDDDDDSPPSPPSKPDSSMITRHYYHDGFPAPFPTKVEPPKAPRYDEYYKPPPRAPPRYDEYYKPPPGANPPMIAGGYYGDGFYPPGGNPVNFHVHLNGPQGLQAPNQNANSNENANSNHNANNNPNANSNNNSQAGLPGWRQHNPQVRGGNYNPYGFSNSQSTGGGRYNPQVQRGNKVDRDGDSDGDGDGDGNADSDSDGDSDGDSDSDGEANLRPEIVINYNAVRGKARRGQWR